MAVTIHYSYHAIHTLLALLNSSFKLSSKLTANNNNKRGGEQQKYLKHLPLILSFAVNCSPTQAHTDRHTQAHTHSYSPVSLYNFISVLAAVFIPCSSSAGLISAAGRLPPPSLSALSLAVCVTCAAIWPRIMSSVRYLEPVCICISSCGCWYPLQRREKKKKKR